MDLGVVASVPQMRHAFGLESGLGMYSSHDVHRLQAVVDRQIEAPYEVSKS